MDPIQNTTDISENSAQKAEQRKRKIIKGALIFSAVVIVLSLIFSTIDPEKLVKKMFHGEEQQKQIIFYPLDDPMNRLDNADYLEMDRRLFINNPFEGVTYSVDKSDLNGEDDFVLFFYEYFDAVKHGDTERLLSMYSVNYKDAKSLPDFFTVQLVYDITIYPQTEGGSVVAYRVDYRIHRNNGTFRNDVESDTIRPLMFTLGLENGELKITSIVPYTSYVRN